MTITVTLLIDESTGVVTIVPASPAAPVVMGPPLVCTGEATMFGLNWDGTIDQSDNGIGVWGAKTANQTIVGCSLPQEVLIATCGLSGSWASAVSGVGAFLKANAVQVMVSRGTLSVLCDIVDAGPSQTTHNAIDLTYYPAHYLGTNGKAIVSYQILKNGKTPMTIGGWDFVAGMAIAMPGVV